MQTATYEVTFKGSHVRLTLTQSEGTISFSVSRVRENDPRNSAFITYSQRDVEEAIRKLALSSKALYDENDYPPRDGPTIRDKDGWLVSTGPILQEPIIHYETDPIVYKVADAKAVLSPPTAERVTQTEFLRIQEELETQYNATKLTPNWAQERAYAKAGEANAAKTKELLRKFAEEIRAALADKITTGVEMDSNKFEKMLGDCVDKIQNIFLSSKELLRTQIQEALETQLQYEADGTTPSWTQKLDDAKACPAKTEKLLRKFAEEIHTTIASEISTGVEKDTNKFEKMLGDCVDKIQNIFATGRGFP